MAIALFAINVHGLGMPSFFIKMPVFATIPTLLALIFLALFIFYLTVIWGYAYDACKKLYPSDFSRGTYIWSQISFAIPVLLPWLIISGIYDLIYALPFAGPKKIHIRPALCRPQKNISHPPWSIFLFCYFPGRAVAGCPGDDSKNLGL
jgi:hypothetical protein